MSNDSTGVSTCLYPDEFPEFKAVEDSCLSNIPRTEYQVVYWEFYAKCIQDNVVREATAFYNPQELSVFLPVLQKLFDASLRFFEGTVYNKRFSKDYDSGAPFSKALILEYLLKRIIILNKQKGSDRPAAQPVSP
ncbi:MAG: hypothetical protein HQL56_07255 [Magnetococcales bacterium]|nr:hypothetical protein [Magnetococcales bacterium]